MKNLINVFVTRFVGTISIFGSIVLFGLVSYIGLGIDLFPEIEVPIVAVTTVYPGSGSEEIARQVSEPLEGALSTLPGIRNVTSTSAEGYSIVIAEFDAGVDVDQGAIDVSQRINTVIGQLPDDAQTPTILKFDPSDTPIMNVAISAPGESLIDIQDYVEDNIRPELQRVEGVADVSVVGPTDREVQVLLDAGLLETYNIAPAQVTGAIASSALDLPLGDITFTGSRVLLTGRNTPETLRSVEEILVDSSRGIRVIDVASVRDSSADVDTYVRVNGEPVVLLEIQKVSGGNSVAAAQNVRKALESITLPDGYSTEVVNDSTLQTAETVAGTIEETLLAIIAVAIVIMFFVGRLGTILAVVLSIPISMAGALILFGLAGFTLNLITLLAITVAVGLVVDDSIVVAENIDRYMGMGYTRKDAVVQGAAEVGAAVLAATLSLLAVFLPISFLPGIIGDFFAQFGLSMATMIFFSYLASMFFLTMALAYIPNPLPPTWSDFAKTFTALPADIKWAPTLFKRVWFWALAVAVAALLFWRVQPLAAAAVILLPVVLPLLRYAGRIIVFFVGAILLSFFQFGNWITNKTRDAYVSTLDAMLPFSWITLVIATFLLLSLGVVLPRLEFTFTPPEDSGNLAATIELPSGTSLDRTNLLTMRIEDVLLSDPLITTVQATVGAADDTGSTSSERATISFEMVDKHERDFTTDEYALIYEDTFSDLLRDYPEADISVGTAAGGAPETSAYELHLASTDLDALRERETAIRTILEENPALRNINSSLAATVTERVFILDNSSLSGTGLDAASVYATLRTYNVGSQAATLRSEGNELPIVVSANPGLIRDEQTLLSLPIMAPALQTEIPIGQLGRFETRDAPSTINRANRSYSLDFTADLAPDAPDVLTIRSQVEAQLVEQNLVDNQVAITAGTGIDLLGDLVTYGPIAFALALLLNYLVIGTQFNSFKFPIYILLTVPLALIGAFWLLYFMDTALDIISVLGVIMLIGLAAKNAILLLEVIMEQIQEEGGKVPSLRHVMVEAGRLRFRPIVMTTAAVVIISLPLLLGLGEGAEFRYSLGLVILGGVVTSALLTFYVVPAAFYLFERKNLESGEGGQGEKIKPEQERTVNRQPGLSPSPQTASTEL